MRKVKRAVVMSGVAVVMALLARQTSWGKSPAQNSGVTAARVTTFCQAVKKDTLVPMEVEKTQAYIQIVAPILDDLGKKLPDLAREMRDLLSRKQWLFSTAPIPELGSSVNGTSLPLQQVAEHCQDNGRVLINRDWYRSRPSGGPQGRLEQQAGIILHEIGVGLFLARNNEQWNTAPPEKVDAGTRDYDLFHESVGGRYMGMDEVREFVGLLLAKPPFSAERLQSEIYDRGIGEYLTAHQIPAFRDLILKKAKDLAIACGELKTEGQSFANSIGDFSRVTQQIEDKILSPGPRVFEALSPTRYGEDIQKDYLRVWYMDLSQGTTRHPVAGSFGFGRSNGMITDDAGPACQFARHQLAHLDPRVATGSGNLSVLDMLSGGTEESAGSPTQKGDAR